MPKSAEPEAHIALADEALLDKVTLHMSEVLAKPSALRAIMSRFGFAVIKEVCSPEDVAHAEQLFDEDLKSIIDLPADKKQQVLDALPPKVVDDGPATLAKKWPTEKAPIGRRFPQFASDFGIPQGRCAWYCRQHPNVAALFFSLFEGVEGVSSPDDLCAGMDNMFFNNEPEAAASRESAAERVTDVLWPHADQSIHAPEGGDRPCYQSILYLWPSGERRSTTVVWPESHLGVYDEVMAIIRIPHHYCPLPDEMLPQFVEGAVRVPIPAGGIIVWNSKLIHQGWNIGPRLAVPMCMEPRTRRKPDAWESKREACERGYPTTHWASLGLWHGASSLAPGGTNKFPLKALAHRWMFRPCNDEASPSERMNKSVSDLL